MTETIPHRRRGLSRSAVRTLFLVGFVMAIAGLAVAGHISSPAEYTGQPVVSASSSGPTVALPAGATDANFADFAINDSALQVQTHNGGNATFVASDATFAVAESLSGRWANLTSIDAAGTELHMAADARPAATVSGALDTFALRDEIHPDDGHVDFTFSGASGTTNVTLGGLNPHTEYFAWDHASETSLASGTSDANGVVTFADMPNSAHAVMIHKQPTPDTDGQVADMDIGLVLVLAIMIGLLALLTVHLRSATAMAATTVGVVGLGLHVVGLIPADFAILLTVLGVVVVGALVVLVWRVL